LKQDVHPITDYETILSSVDGVRFHWKDTGRPDVGVIAQSLLPVLPEAVMESGGTYKVDYLKLIPVLIQSIKALQERVAALERGFNVIQQGL
jgi:Chaperone of endosialidase